MISIIIPNYNSEKYISKCLDSILSQNYNDFEVIVVDDGSTDQSAKIIQKYCKKHKEITLICQDNLNAAIARNRGLKTANGDYALFLDSDDELEPNALSDMVETIKKNNLDLVIGGFVEIKETGEKTGEYHNHEITGILEKESILRIATDFKPVPSNKLYSMKVIRDNGLYWGNVRIGQDLNFYLKYLLHCKKIGIINKSVFKYRLTKNSISRSYDFRIFDITNSFKDVRRHYSNMGALNYYEKYIQSQELKHYNDQLSKQCNYTNRSSRKLIFDYFIIHTKQIHIDEPTKNDRLLMRKILIKRILKTLYISSLYRYIKTRNDR